MKMPPKICFKFVFMQNVNIGEFEIFVGVQDLHS